MEFCITQTYAHDAVNTCIWIALEKMHEIQWKSQSKYNGNYCCQYFNVSCDRESVAFVYDAITNLLSDVCNYHRYQTQMLNFMGKCMPIYGMVI